MRSKKLQACNIQQVSKLCHFLGHPLLSTENNSELFFVCIEER